MLNKKELQRTIKSMPYYKDKTFCNQECANTECPRNFNDGVMSGEKSWWRGEEPPVYFANLRNDDCGFVDIKK